MKKILHAIILLTVCCSILITSGCASDPRSNSSAVSVPDTGSDIPIVSDTDPVSEPDEGFELVPISEIRKNFSQLVDELCAGEFINLDFSNAEFGFPEIDSISRLSLSVPTGKSPRELYDFVCDSIDMLMPGVYSDEEKLNGIKFIYWDNDMATEPLCLTIDEYEFKVTDEAPALFLRDDKCDISVFSNTLQIFERLDHKWYDERGDRQMIAFALSLRAIDYITDPENCTDKYELINGEISVKDAAEFVNSFLETTEFSPYEQPAKTKIIGAEVSDMGDEKYGYAFFTTYEYKKVLFDYFGVRRNNRVGNDYDNRDYVFSYPGAICMVETDKVSYFEIPTLDYSIEEDETYTSVITLQDAANIISGFFSDYMNFSVTRVEPVYLTYENTSVPCWKFLMRCSGYVYNTFVDMQTGEVHLYIQKGE